MSLRILLIRVVAPALLFTAIAASAQRLDIDYPSAQAAVREAAYGGRADAQRLYGALLARDPAARQQQVLQGLHWVLLSAENGDGEAQNVVRQMDEYDPNQMKEARSSYEGFKATLPMHLRTSQLKGSAAPVFPEQSRIDRDTAEWAAAVSSRVHKFWRRPMGSPGQFNCQVRVEQSSLGKVLNAQVEKSCGSEALDISVLRAVQTASPLPPLPQSVPFERSFLLSFCPSAGACQ